MELTFLNNIKSGVIASEIEKSLVKLNPALLVPLVDSILVSPALDNVLESIGLVEKEKQKDRTRVKRAIREKVIKYVKALDGLNTKG